jgi:PIN domain
MSELHVLVDFENVQPTMDDLIKLAPKLKEVWLFHGPSQTKGAEKVKGDDPRVTLVPHSGKGKNALDFHLTFYLGYLAAKRIEPALLVVANDRGYDSMLSHANGLGIKASRVGFKVKKAVAVKKAVPAPPKKAVAKAPAPEVPAVKKPAVKKVTAKKVAVKQAPAKAVPAKKAVAKKSAPKKAAVQKPAAVNSAPAAKSAAKAVAPKAPAKAASADKVLARAKAALTKMGKNRPTKLSKLLRHLTSIVGQGATLDQADALSRQLEEAEVIQVVGDLVLYP